MPFTPSHIAAIVPFSRTPLPAAGLVIGSMVPDLPYFVPIGIPREYSHSLIGAITADLPMGILSYLLWVFVLRSPLVDYAPRWLHDRFRVAPRSGPFLRFALLLIVAVLIGIATHLLWDSFTHPDGLVVLHVAALRTPAGPFAVSRWLQYASSVIGLVIVAMWAVRWTGRTPRQELSYRRTVGPMRLIARGLGGATLLVVGGTVWGSGLARGTEPLDRVLAYDTAVYSIAASAAVGLLLCLLWYAAPRRATGDLDRAEHRDDLAE